MSTKTSTALVPITPAMPTTVAMPSLPELQVMEIIAVQAVKARGMVPTNIDTAEKALAIMLAGREIGAQPMTALRHMYVVNGRTELGTQLQMGVVRRGDPTAEFIFHEQTAEACEVELKRGGMSVLRLRCTFKEHVEPSKAHQDWDKQANGYKDKLTWKRYPIDMMRWFTIRRVCRLGASDLTAGLQPVTVASAQRLMDSTPAAPELVEGEVVVDLRDPKLYSEGDTPDTPVPVEVQAAVIEGVDGGEGEAVDAVARGAVQEPSGSTPDVESGAASPSLSPTKIARAAFDDWCKAEKLTPAHVANWLRIEDNCEDPLQRHWIERAEKGGISAVEAISLAQELLTSVKAEYEKGRAAGVPAAQAVREAIGAVSAKARLDEMIKNLAPAAEQQPAPEEELPTGEP